MPGLASGAGVWDNGSPKNDLIPKGRAMTKITAAHRAQINRAMNHIRLQKGGQAEAALYGSHCLYFIASVDMHRAGFSRCRRTIKGMGDTAREAFDELRFEITQDICGT